MAEGILGKAASDLWQVYSAGSRPTGYVHPLAVAALAELGIDILGHTSKAHKANLLVVVVFRSPYNDYHILEC